MDAQSVKNTHATRQKGYGADKKVPGIKRPSQSMRKGCRTRSRSRRLK